MIDKRFSKSRCLAGVDGCNVEYILGLTGMENLYLPPEELKNKAGNTIASIECIGGKIKAYVNVVHTIRRDNVEPFSIWDAAEMEPVRIQIIEFMKEYLQKNLEDRYSDDLIQNMRVKALECNLTLPTAGKATPSDVIALLDLALDKTVVFRRRKPQSAYEKMNTSCLYSKPREFCLKVYSKTEEQHEKGNPLVEKNLLRIEIKFIDRALRRMFWEKRSLLDVLSAQGIETTCRQYKRVLEKDIINKSIKPCLAYCVRTLLESMETSDTGREISEAVTRHKELIVDMEVLRRASKRWYDRRGEKDKSKQIVCYYRKKQFGLPDDVLKTIRAFHEAAG